MNILSANELMTVRQHGAMEYVTPPTDLDDVRRYRLKRIQDELVRQDLAGMADHMGVGDRVLDVHLRFDAGDFLLQKFRLDIAVAIPCRLSVLQFNAVDHATRQKPVLAKAGRRVGAIEEISAIKLGRDSAGQLQVKRGDFFGDGGVIANQIWIHSGIRSCAHTDIV